jgi:hypothetical protein
VRRSATPRWDGVLSVFVTGERGDGMLGLDNFYAYYDLALKRARKWLLVSRGMGGCDASCAGLGGRDAPSCAGLGGRVKGGHAPSRAGQGSSLEMVIVGGGLARGAHRRKGCSPKVEDGGVLQQILVNN